MLDINQALRIYVHMLRVMKSNPWSEHCVKEPIGVSARSFIAALYIARPHMFDKCVISTECAVCYRWLGPRHVALHVANFAGYNLKRMLCQTWSYVSIYAQQALPLTSATRVSI